MKKKLALMLAAAFGLAAYRKRSAAQQERDLWQEATKAPDLR